MVAKQLSIFLENKSGRLTEVTEVLAKENINLSVRMCRELWQKCWDSCRQRASLSNTCIHLPIIMWQML